MPCYALTNDHTGALGAYMFASSVSEKVSKKQFRFKFDALPDINGVIYFVN